MGECLIMRRGGETYKPAILNTAYPQDVSVTVIKGSTKSAVFNVLIAEAGTPAQYTYQWYKDGVAVDGATESSYVADGLAETGENTVFCEVTNKGGTVKSRVATLSVTQHYTPTLNGNYPADVTGLEIGSSATFKVEIASAGFPASYTYQWYLNGSAVSGATSASFTGSDLAKGSYTVYCEVTNAAGTVRSRTATLTVTKQYLFKSGSGLYSNVTGDMKTAGVSANDNWTAKAPTRTIASDKMTMTLSNDGYLVSGVVYTANKIDLTNVSKIYFNGSSSGVADYMRNLIALSSISSAGIVVSATGIGNGSALDVSSLSGSYYLGFYLGAGGAYNAGEITCTITCTEWWME